MPCRTSSCSRPNVRSSAPSRKRTQDAGRCILHICMFYVSVHSAFAPLPRPPPSSFSLSIFLSPSFPGRPLIAVLPFSTYPRLFFSLNPVLLHLAFRLSYLFFGSTRASRIAGREVNELRKSERSRTKKGVSQGGKRVTIQRWYA